MLDGKYEYNNQYMLDYLIENSKNRLYIMTDVNFSKCIKLSFAKRIIACTDSLRNSVNFSLFVLEQYVYQIKRGTIANKNHLIK